MVKPTTKNKAEVSQKEDLEKEVSEFSYDFGPSDELIASLANAHENRRARQVYEWELLRRKIYQSPS